MLRDGFEQFLKECRHRRRRCEISDGNQRREQPADGLRFGEFLCAEVLNLLNQHDGGGLQQRGISLARFNHRLEEARSISQGLILFGAPAHRRPEFFAPYTFEQDVAGGLIGGGLQDGF